MGHFLVSRKKLDSFNWNDVKGVTFLGQRKGGMPQMVGGIRFKEKMALILVKIRT